MTIETIAVDNQEQKVWNGEVILEAPEPRRFIDSIWHLNMDRAVARLEAIKKMDPKDVASALCDLFWQYASVDGLGADFCAEDETGLDLSFINNAMTAVFPELGYGSFSTAYLFDANWIIKVNNVCEELSPQDGGFDWIKTCTQIQNNSFVPKIASVAQKNRQYFAVIERLEENHENHVVDGFCFTDLSECAHDETFNLEEYIDEISSHDLFIQMLNANSSDLIQLAHAYEQCRDDSGLEADLHSFNLMFRGDTPIINDPFAIGDNLSLQVGSEFKWSMA